MSLKAKLEAVIYAAEEPVTLTQLAALFAADALAWKSAQESAAAAAAEPAGTESGPQENAEFEYRELEQPSETTAEANDSEPETTREDSLEAREEPSPLAAAEGEPEAGDEVTGEAAVEADADPVDAEAEEKRLARQRDRDARTVLRELLDELIATYASDDRGIEIKEIAGGYRMATKPECHDAARMFVKSLKPAMKLSLPALETLAVIAYKQPVTAPEVNEIRGVESSGVFGSLLARKLIATAGRKQVIGRPILYKTTKEFLLRFGLKDVQELPSMDEFEKMAQLEFEDMGPLAEEEPGAATGDDGLPEVDNDPDETAAATGQQESQAPEASTEEQNAQQEARTAAIADNKAVRPLAEEEPGAATGDDGLPEVDNDPDETAAATGQQDSQAPEASTEEQNAQEDAQTAAIADSDALRPLTEEEPGAAIGGDGLPEMDSDPHETSAATGQQDSEAPEASTEEKSKQEDTQTAAMADSDPIREVVETDTLEPPAEAPATHADRTPAEAAPAAPSFPVQAETETVSHE
jgi:segregation and condensation protein B